METRIRKSERKSEDKRMHQKIWNKQIEITIGN